MLINHNDLLKILITEIKNIGSQARFASIHNIDRSSLNNILRGKRSIPDSLALILGYESVFLYRRLRPNDKTQPKKEDAA